MLKTSPKIQKPLADALTFISQQDFPSGWPNLICVSAPPLFPAFGYLDTFRSCSLSNHSVGYLQSAQNRVHFQLSGYLKDGSFHFKEVEDCHPSPTIIFSSHPLIILLLLLFPIPDIDLRCPIPKNSSWNCGISSYQLFPRKCCAFSVSFTASSLPSTRTNRPE